MTAQAQLDRAPDVVASGTLVAVALIALSCAWALPWWEMQARAPQYGQRTLVVEVSPRGVKGDVFEVDNLGHYVGIRKMENFARVERSLAPYGMLAAFAGLLLAPWLRRRSLRLVAALPPLLLPVIFMWDLDVTMARAANERDPHAALNLVLSHVDTKLFGQYVVAQFKVTAKPAAGLWLAGIAALLALGLAFAAPVPLRRRGWRRAAKPAVAALILFSVSARAAQIQVRPGETISTALEAAAPHDTLRIVGTHREHVVVRKPVRIIAEPGAVVDGGGEGTVLRIEASGVEVVGLEVRSSGEVYSREDAGIRIERAADVRLEQVRVLDSLFGIFAAQADRCWIRGSTVVGKEVPADRRGDGIRLWYSSGCTLRDNLIERSRDLVIWYSSATSVENNTVRGSRYGLHYMYSNDNVFRRNRFEDNEVGAAIMYSKRIRLEENAFSFSTGPSADGLLLKDADDVFIERNRFVGNSIGLFVDGAPQSRGGQLDVTRNLFARNDFGVVLQPSTAGARFWENAFVGNRAQVQIQGTGTAERNTWSVDGRGNYWGDAIIYDREGRGVSALPYRLENTYESLAARRPVLAFFTGTPAAEAIDLAARLFPVFAPRAQLTDPHPLSRAPLDDWTSGDSARTSLSFPAAGALMLLASASLPLLSRRLLA
jgi:nitrous oxidase accessory protein